MGACGCGCLYLVSADKILHFMNTLIIIIINYVHILYKRQRGNYIKKKSMSLFLCSVCISNKAVVCISNKLKPD